MSVVIDSTSPMYNGDGLRKCYHYKKNTTINNKNNNTISTAPKYSKVGVDMEVEVVTVVATYYIIFLLQNTPAWENIGVWVKAVFDFIVAMTSNKPCEHSAVAGG